MRILPILLLAACAATPPTPPGSPSTPPPVPPQRDVNVAAVSGQVRNERGNPVGRALVTLTLADDQCRSLGQAVSMPADDSGEFVIRAEGEAGPQYSRCVIVEATSGGATGREQVVAPFSSAATSPARVIISLNEKTTLDKSEAQRLVELLSDAIDNPGGIAAGELSLYVTWGDEAIRAAVEQYRQLLGVPTRVVFVDEAVTGESRYPTRRFSFELRGSTGRSARIDVYQEDLTRMHSLLLDYGMRSERFVMAYIRAIASGDAEMLSRVLNPDDVDFPVARAREMIVTYRSKYDTATLRPEFVSADDRRHTITWRIKGRTPGGGEASELIELITGDGLIGVNDL